MLRSLLVLVSMLLGASALLAQQAAGEPRPWEHESSDIRPDPAIRFGALDNGMRWAWRDNPEPDERCYVRLHIDVGSLAEQDDEQGLAHVLEHMAFNGSRNFPPGTLIEWFQEHGMSFGADTNASTDFSATIYQLDLPHSDEGTLSEGLVVLRDIADGLLLGAREIADELGVIDGEERERDSAQMRAALADLEDVYAGSLIAERIPIGVAEVRARFGAEGMRAFYERWYRPELMTLIVVGDLGGVGPGAAHRRALRRPGLARHAGAERAVPPGDQPRGAQLRPSQ